MGQGGLGPAAIGGVIGGAPGSLVGGVGLSNIGKTFGLSGEQGEYYNPGAGPQLQDQYSKLLSSEAGNQEGRVAAEIAGKVQRGEISPQQALQEIGTKGPEQQQSLTRAFATGPVTGTRLATSEVQNNPILGQLYGQGGTLGRTTQEEQELAQRGFSLKPEDYEAYGQASGELSRIFGSQEQNLAQALAARGLAQAPSGAAGTEFAGLYGTKAEQLAGLQRDIADKRMQMNLERLGQTRQFLGQLGNQAGNEIQRQYGRQMGGVEEQRGALAQGAQAEAQRNAEELQKYGMGGQLGLQSMYQKIGQKAPTLGEAFGAGLMSSASNVGAAPGKFVSSGAGAAGSSAGKGAMA